MQYKILSNFDDDVDQNARHDDKINEVAFGFVTTTWNQHKDKSSDEAMTPTQI